MAFQSPFNVFNRFPAGLGVSGTAGNHDPVGLFLYKIIIPGTLNNGHISPEKGPDNVVFRSAIYNDNPFGGQFDEKVRPENMIGPKA